MDEVTDNIFTQTAPPTFKPWLNGKYSVAPGLKLFGSDFGNGKLDQQYFVLDSEFPRYLQNRLAGTREDEDKYIKSLDLTDEAAKSVGLWIVSQLAEEHPELVEMKEGQIAFRHSKSSLNLPGASGEEILKFAGLQIQDDFSIIQRNFGRDWISYLNLFSPSRWGAEEKIGRSFFEAHTPVPGFEPVNRVASELIDRCITRGPFIRFVWSLESSDRLNRHPEAIPGVTPEAWYERKFSAGNLHVRVERQVLIGFPGENALLFLIKTGHFRYDELIADPLALAKLLEACEGMDEGSRPYKGVTPEALQVLRNAKI